MTSGVRDTSEFLADVDALLATMPSSAEPPAAAETLVEPPAPAEPQPAPVAPPPPADPPSPPAPAAPPFPPPPAEPPAPVEPPAPAPPAEPVAPPQAAPTNTVPPPPKRPATVGRADGGPSYIGKGPIADIAPPAPAEKVQEKDTVEDVEGVVDVEDEEDEEDEPEEAQQAEPAESGETAEGGPVEKTTAITAKSGAKTAAASGAEKALKNPRLRAALFNLAAAGVGQWLGVVPVFREYLPYAEQAATGMVGLFLAAGGAAVAWKLVGYVTNHKAVRLVLPGAPLLQIAMTLGAAGAGHQSARDVVPWINRHGQQWGLGADALSLLLTAGAMCGGLYWLVDRRTRPWHWTARFVFRVPLASALIATALYATGN
ncbi:hypothetical protein ACFV1C_00205 [Streptomyces sp. NPDC059605]|uniref:hypothetical protein n=1 Tax=Streptomyces sp. NPDC059605 TaxID=3346882 RepID=UPI0036C64914